MQAGRLNGVCGFVSTAYGHRGRGFRANRWWQAGASRIYPLLDAVVRVTVVDANRYGFFFYTRV